jgi:hypothetical protein
MGTIQHNFQFIQGVLLSITLNTTCFGTLLVPSSGVSVEPFCVQILHCNKVEKNFAFERVAPYEVTCHKTRAIVSTLKRT